MKTIKQIADEIGVTKDALRKRISREPLKSMVEPHIIIQDTTKYLTDKGTDIIMLSLGTSTSKYSDNTAEKTNMSMDTEDKTMDKLLQTMDNMRADHKAELEVKNKQIEELNARLAEVTELANTSQRLHAGTIQQQLTTAETPTDEIEGEKESDLNKVDHVYKEIVLNEIIRDQNEEIKQLKSGFFGFFRRKSYKKPQNR